MAEFGLDLSREFPEPLRSDVVETADVVVSVSCGDACPVLPGERDLDWDLTDAAGRGVDDVRPIRDDIDRRVRDLRAELVPPPAEPGAPRDGETGPRIGPRTTKGPSDPVSEGPCVRVGTTGAEPATP